MISGPAFAAMSDRAVARARMKNAIDLTCCIMTLPIVGNSSYLKPG